MKKMTGETLFCVKYLLEHGVNSSNFDDTAKLLEAFNVPEYKLVKLGKDEWFHELATKLRPLWPAGDKDGKWAWRDSVKNLSDRLKLLWQQRQLKEYSIDECLSCARRYLAQYENDTRYMMLLKYFIMKQKSIVDPKDGRLIYTIESRLADMLEGKSEIDALENELDSILEDTSVGEGELV